MNIVPVRLLSREKLGFLNADCVIGNGQGNQEQRIAAESSEEREARLQLLRRNQEQRIAAETSEEREARLQLLRRNQEQRIVAESSEEREARLQQLRHNQQQRIASETLQETEARRQRDRESHVQQTSAVTSNQPELHQPMVQSKMSKFHSEMASLQMSMCITCRERFPGLTVRMTSSGTECLRCVRDKHSPKAYSSLNNMDPGTVPHELFVSASTHLADMLYYPICKLASARQKCHAFTY